MRPVIGAMFVAFLAVQNVRSAELAITSNTDRVPEGTIEFYDDEVDFGDELPQDAQKAEYLKMIMAELTCSQYNTKQSRFAKWSTRCLHC